MSHDTREIVKTALIVILCLFIMQLFLGCASVYQKLDSATYYKRDIFLEVNGQVFEGVGVPKRALSYKIKVKARGTIDMITVRSCHREFAYEEPSKGWFSKGNTFEFVYTPIPGIEDGSGCLLDIGTFEKDKGRHGWGLLSFEGKNEQTNAALKCNGQFLKSTHSVSVCQGREGTLQEIQFDHRVKVSPDAGCKTMMTKDERRYQFTVSPKECNYYFCGVIGDCHFDCPDSFRRLTAFLLP